MDEILCCDHLNETSLEFLLLEPFVSPIFLKMELILISVVTGIVKLNNSNSGGS